MGTAVEVQETGTAHTQPEPMDQRTKQVMQLVGNDRAKAEKILRVAANAVKKVPALQSCDQGKLWLAILDVASMNLNFGPRGAYLVPYQSDVTVIVSPHGLIELAYRHPLVKAIQARVVRVGEPFRIAYAPEPIVVHEPCIGEQPGEMIGAYAIIDLTTGGRVVEWMTRADIMKAKAVSRAANSSSSPWAKWEDEMWRKTVLKRAMKYVPQSDDMQRAFEREDDDADFTVVEDTSAHVLAATTGTSALRERVLARRAEPAEVKAPDREPGEEG
jgi:recombination protein RecT